MVCDRPSELLVNMHTIILSYLIQITTYSPTMDDIAQVGTEISPSYPFSMQDGSLRSKPSTDYGFTLGLNFEDWEVAKGLQKLIIFGISSLLDSSTSISSSIVQPDNQMISRRTMTTQVIESLIETCGIDWMRSFPDSSKHQSEMGQAGKKNESDSSIFSMVARLVSGEIRIILGNIIDYKYSLDTESYFRLMEDSMKSCIQIMLSVLRTIIQFSILQEEADDIRDSEASDYQFLPFDLSAEVILHIRDSLEDTLDSVMQFLLSGEDTHKRKEFLFQCCRFLGAYLSEVDLFEYADTLTSYEEQTKTTCLLQAIKNAIVICRTRDQQLYYSHCDELGNNVKNTASSNMILHSNIITLLPCINTIIENCQNVDNKIGNRMSLAEKYLFKEDMILIVIRDTVKLYQDVFGDNNTKAGNHTTETVETMCDFISWCNITIASYIKLYLCGEITATTSNRRDLQQIIESICNLMKMLIMIFTSQHPKDQRPFVLKKRISRVKELLRGTMQSVGALDELCLLFPEDQWDGQLFLVTLTRMESSISLTGK